MCKAVLAGMVVVAVCGPAVAAPCQFDGQWLDVAYWAGAGASQAVMAVDFGAGVRYAFGYRFDGAKTSWDMLQAVDAAGGLDMLYTMYVFGPAVDQLSYAGHVAVSNWTDTFLGYWTSADGQTWTPSQVGASSRVLADNDWDGWSLELVENGYDPIYPPTIPRPLEGDCDSDRTVDFADYQLLEVGFGKTVGATWAAGDFDHNGAVDFADYQALETRFGQSLPAPEPGSLAILCAGIAALGGRKRR